MPTCSACTEGHKPPAPVCGGHSETCWLNLLVSKFRKQHPAARIAPSRLGPGALHQEPSKRDTGMAKAGRKGKRRGQGARLGTSLPTSPEEPRASTNKTHPQASPAGPLTPPGGGPAPRPPTAPAAPGARGAGRAGPGRAGGERGVAAPGLSRTASLTPTGQRRACRPAPAARR